MACDGLRTCENPGNYCPDNKYDLGTCVAPPLNLRFNPGAFFAGVPNVPPVLEPIITLECPEDSEIGVVISSRSGQSFFRTSNLISNQRFRARLFLLQADDPGAYRVVISGNNFSPFITVSRNASTFWQLTGTDLTFNLSVEQTGPLTIEVTTELPQVLGTFNIAIECPMEPGCPGFELMSYWKLDEASGTRFDSHGNNDLSLSPFFGQEPLVVPGIINNAVLVSSVNSSILWKQGASGLWTFCSGITMAGWFKFPIITSDPGNSGPGLFALTGPGTLFSFLFPGDGNAYAHARTGMSSVSALIGGIVLNTFQFYRFWIDPSDFKIRCRVNEGSTSVSPSALSTTSFIPGLNLFLENAPLGDATIDEVGVWRGVMTDADAASLYNGGAGKSYPNVPGIIP